MSRLGKKPIPLPKTATPALNGQTIKIKGPKGELSYTAPDNVEITQGNDGITVRPRDDSKPARAMWGTTWASIRNILTGVTDGYVKELEINGVGYRAAVQGKKLNLALGYSHDINYDIPTGIDIKTPKPTEITVSGIDKQRVGQVAAEIRAFRGPEPYKGKGIKYKGEYIFRKEGKKK
ncbi:MAG: 50S ribosomal protein L6 [Pseudomonadota bacterium]